MIITIDNSAGFFILECRKNNMVCTFISLINICVNTASYGDISRCGVSLKLVKMMFYVPKKIFHFYVDGFRRMTLGRTLWKIIAIKLIVMFAVLKLFFFPNYLKTNFDTDRQRADHVISQLTQDRENTTK